MAIVYLTTPGASVRRRGERLEVWAGEQKLGDVRMFDLERLVLAGPVQLTTQAIGLLLDRGVDVSFLSGSGRHRGTLVSGQSRNVFVRLAQFDRWKDKAFCAALARELIAAKLAAQYLVLLRYQRNHPGRIDPASVARVAKLRDQMASAQAVDTVRGLEGAGSAAYFREFGAMLSTVGFPGRQKHPARDPANALLSLGYVLVTNELAGLSEAVGLDPFVGFLHGIRYGRKSLPLDLVEPFRQPIVDRFTLRLFNLRQITPDDFEGGEQGLRLRPAALKRYLEAYDEHLRSPSTGARAPTWRDVLAAHVGDIRAMVMDGHVRPVYTWND